MDAAIKGTKSDILYLLIRELKTLHIYTVANPRVDKSTFCEFEPYELTMLK